jgi:hypothetical protein
MCWAKIKIYQDFFGLEAFGGIFDAAATGQYWVGIDLLNDNQNTKFFKNENSDKFLNDLIFSRAHNRLSSKNQKRFCM